MEDIVSSVLVILGALAVLAIVQGGVAAHARRYLWLAFAAHVVSSLLMVWVTQDVLGGGDMFVYHRVGSALAEKLREDFSETAGVLWQVMLHEEVPLPVPAHGIASSTGAMHAFSGFIMFLVGDSVYAGCALISFAAFFARFGLYRVLREELQDLASDERLLIACLLVPSVIFWSSSMLKESIVITGVCAMVVGGQRLARHRRIFTGGAILAGGAFIVGSLKAYILVPFGAAAGVWFYATAIASNRKAEHRLVNIALGSALAVAFIVGTTLVFPQYSLGAFAQETAHHQEVGVRTAGDSNYTLGDAMEDEQFNAENASLGGQLALAPIGMATALFRPLVFEARNPQMLVNSAETTLVTAVLLWGLYRRGVWNGLRRIVAQPFLIFSVVFVLGMALGVGLATTNLGTLSRYRMPFMPFFVLLVLEVAQFNLAPVFRVRARELDATVAS